MSMYLFDDSPIVVNTTLANEIGLNEAIVLQQINYWIEINKKAGKNYYDGKYWTYNSIKSWHEKNFKFLSVETVRRVFTKLEKSGFIITGNYNKDPRDKTKWYTKYLFLYHPRYTGPSSRQHQWFLGGTFLLLQGPLSWNMVIPDSFAPDPVGHLEEQ